LVVKINAEKLATALHQNADEPRAESISEAIAGKLFTDTLSLAQGIRDCLHISDEEEREQTVRRVFQAIRIAVNEEFHALDAFLRAVPTCLKLDGRVAILTFHSGEDRRVKQAFKLGLQDGSYSQICETPITASPEERRANPRSTSAKLRWAVRA
jgi:16S rRNA (cytosine1402-N4)-methyltransferase